MAYENRIYLKWDEAADLLGMDREGLRQAMLYRLSPARHDPDKSWLPVLLTAPGDGFLTMLDYRSWGRQADFYWNNRDSFYRVVERDRRRELTFSDGSSIPMRGNENGDGWAPDHGQGTGWGLTFSVWGNTLTLCPESVRDACENEGFFRGGLGIAPRAWCKDGFPFDMFFVIVSCNNTIFQAKPENLFESGLFLRDDVLRIAQQPSGSSEAVNAAKPARIRSDREENLLRVIAGLWAMSNLPAEHNTAADKLSALFDSWGWDKPAKATVADTILKHAARLPGAKIRTSD